MIVGHHTMVFFTAIPWSIVIPCDVTTSQDKYVLRIDLWDWDRGHAYAVYTPFHLENEKENYKIKVGQYSGTAGNAFDATKLHSHKGER